MLRKDQRLNLKIDFTWARQGLHLENQLAKIFIRFGNNEIPKVGIALSKLNFSNASERNRARRLTSQVFQELYPKLPKNVNIVVMPKKEIIKKPMAELKASLEEILKKGQSL